MNEIPVPFLIIITVILAESFLEHKWFHYIYRKGLIIYSRKGNFNEIPEISLLESKFKGSLSPSLVFHKFSETEIGFKEKTFQLAPIQYTPVMRGYITFNDEIKQVNVIGRVNYVTLMLALLFGTVAITGINEINFFGFIFISFLFVTLILLYSVQIYRYNKVFNFISDNKQ